MDFDKIKPAVEEIRLSDEQTAKILEACKAKNRKKRNVWIPVAVAAACAVIVFSPTFSVAMKGANSAMENDGMAVESANGLYCEELADDADFNISQNASSASSKLFDCEGFREIYAVIPFEFSQLVSIGEYEEWKSTVNISNGMAMAQFVEHFAISREAFDVANENYLLSFGDFKAEAFNADIIYTFNKEIIDEYYSE